MSHSTLEEHLARVEVPLALLGADLEAPTGAAETVGPVDDPTL